MPSGSNDGFVPRSLRRIDEHLIACTELSERNILFAKRAVALARHSYIEEAKETVARLRRVNKDYDPRLSAWIMFSEGLIEHCAKPNTDKARDSFIRSHLISQVAKDRELAGASAAWVANCHFVDGKIKESAEHLAKAFEWSDESECEARGRACLVLADGFSMAGALETARHWYNAARTHAVADGDIAMQNVMLFNSAAFHVSKLTLDDCMQSVDAPEVKRALLEVASASNLNSALGIASLPSMIPIMRAELLIIEKRWIDAIQELSLKIPNLEAEGQGRQIPKLLAQLAWCQANIGDRERAISNLEEATKQTVHQLDFDDLSILHFRLAGVGKKVLEPMLESHHRLVADRYMEKFKAQQTEIIGLFTPAADIAASKK